MTKQGSSTPLQNHISSPAMDPNQKEILDLPEKEFRKLVIKLVREHHRKVKPNLRKSKKMIQELKGEIFNEIDSINKKQNFRKQWMHL